MSRKPVNLDAFKAQTTVQKIPKNLPLIYDKFKRSLGASLSGLTRRRIVLDYLSSSVVRGEDLSASLPPRACYEILSMQTEAYSGPMVFVFEEPLLKILINLFYGNKKSENTDAELPELTSLDVLPAKEVVSLAIPALQDAWFSVQKSEMRLTRQSTEQDAKQLGVFLGAQHVISSAFDFRVDNKMGIFLILREHNSHAMSDFSDDHSEER